MAKRVGGERLARREEAKCSVKKEEERLGSADETYEATASAYEDKKDDGETESYLHLRKNQLILWVFSLARRTRGWEHGETFGVTIVGGGRLLTNPLLAPMFRRKIEANLAFSEFGRVLVLA